MPPAGTPDKDSYTSGLSGCGVAAHLTRPEAMHETYVKALAEEMMLSVARKCLEQGARCIGHIKSDLQTAAGTIKADTIGAAHGAYSAGRLERPVTYVYFVVNSIVQGIGEDEVRAATWAGIQEVASGRGLSVVKEREHTYFNPFATEGEGSLVINTDLKVVEANQRAGAIYKLPPEKLVGRDCRLLIGPRARVTLDQALQRLDRDQVWAGELEGRRSEGSLFPMEATINRVDLEEQTLFQVIVRDVTEQRSLEECLRDERRRMEEMNVTLRNVLKAIESEKADFEKRLAHKIETVLLPALDKAREETSPEIRNTYLDIVRGQLTALSDGFEGEFDPRFLRLTPTEMKVCQLIRAGCGGKEIARTLNVSPDTVQTHRKNIRRKLGLRGREINLYAFLSRTRSPKWQGR